MGTDAGNNRWAEGEASSTVNGNIIHHHRGSARVARDGIGMPEVREKRQILTAEASNPSETDHAFNQPPPQTWK